MPRRLVLVRHAKAVQGGPTDAERALAPRGIRDASALGQWLATEKVAPDRVVISPSRRTRQTWEIAAPPDAPAPEIDERIYENTMDDLVEIIRETPPETRTLVLVGHNPSMAELANTIDRQLTDYPTSATAIFELDDWAQAPSGTLITFRVPRG